MLTNAIIVVMLQYTNVSNQNIAHLKLTIIDQFFFIKKISKLFSESICWALMNSIYVTLYNL